MKAGVALAGDNVLEGVAAADWTPLGLSSSGAFAGELAFAGYGIEAPAVGYRELDGIDLKGKVVLMLRYEPQEKDDASPFDGRRPSRWSALRYKVLQARERGAAAVVFVTGPAQDDGQGPPARPQERRPGERGRPPRAPGEAGGGAALAGRRRASTSTRSSARWTATSFRARGRPRACGSPAAWTCRPTYFDAENVAGILAGRGRLAREVVVLGAHYDHLGFGGAGSLRPDARAVHHGADDNASGTAAAILAAERVAQGARPARRERRTLVVALFSGEESGLAGSSAFVGRAAAPLADTVAMINLDMVGRLRDDRLTALGSGTAPQWNEALDRLQRTARPRGGPRRRRLRAVGPDELLRRRHPRPALLHRRARGVPHARRHRGHGERRRRRPASSP